MRRGSNCLDLQAVLRLAERQPRQAQDSHHRRYSRRALSKPLFALEKGGSGLRYSFDIKNGKVTYEVGMEAATGKALENKAESPHTD